MTSPLVRDLGRIVRGDVTESFDARYARARDYGRLVARLPGAVVAPGRASDVAAVLKYASRRGIAVSSQGSAHSADGHSLCRGILLDMRSLNRVPGVDVRSRWVEPEGGASWIDVLRGARAEGLRPPVLTSVLETTVGGTLSVGGIGPSSIRFGSQADNCLGLEVATTDGDLVWCDLTRRRNLFDLVRCGLGQFGVITRARLHLVSSTRPLAVSAVSHTTFEDVLRAVAEFVSVPSVQEVSTSARIRGDGVVYGTRVASVEPRSTSGDDGFRGGRELTPLAVRTSRGPRVWEKCDMGQGRNLKNSGRWFNVGLHYFVPVSAAGSCLTRLQNLLRMEGAVGGEVYVIPCCRDVLGCASLHVPPGRFFVVMGASVECRRKSLGECLSQARRLRESVERVPDVVPYAIGWGSCAALGRVLRKTTRWRQLRRAKTRYDAAGVLNPGAQSVLGGR